MGAITLSVEPNVPPACISLEQDVNISTGPTTNRRGETKQEKLQIDEGRNRPRASEEEKNES